MAAPQGRMASSRGELIVPERAVFVGDDERTRENYIPLNQEFTGLERVHEMPPIYLVHNFLSADECDELKRVGGPGMKRSIVVDGKAGKTSAPTRTSESCFLNKYWSLNQQDHVDWYCERVASLTLKPKEHQEPPQVARYTKDQFYRAHFDAFDLNTGPGRECFRNGGNRVCTVLVYLNDVERGGATYFPKLNFRSFPKQGMALVFFPCSSDGKLDQMALHAGEEAGDEKWVSQVWIRQRDFC